MPSARSAMASTLPGEIMRFRKGARHLRKVLKETKHVHEGIKKEGCYSKEQLAKFHLSPDDEFTVWNIIEQPVGFVVLGSSCWAKACVVNTLLGRSVLPVVPHGQESNWKMVKFTYGKSSKAKLVNGGYEVLDHIEYNTDKSKTVPLVDLEIKNNTDNENTSEASGTLEISLLHPLLHDNVQLVVAPGRKSNSFFQDLKECMAGVTPVLIYAVGHVLSEQDIADLTEFRQLPQRIPIFFVCCHHPSMSDLTESGQHEKSLTPPPSPTSPSSPRHQQSFAYTRHPLEQLAGIRYYSQLQAAVQEAGEVYQRLSDLGFVPAPRSEPEYKGSLEVCSELVEDSLFFPTIVLYVSHVLQSKLLLAATLLQDTHARSLQSFILAAFDLSRDLMVTPKRIQYAKLREDALYRSLLHLASHKQDEIRNMIVATVSEMRESIVTEAASYQFQNVIMDSEFQEPLTARTVHLCTTELRNMVIEHVNKAVSAKLATSIEWLQEKFIGTLERCVNSLEEACGEGEDRNNSRASAALKHILTAAYQVEVSFRNSASIFWFVLQKMKQLAEVLPWNLPSTIDATWKQEVALKMLSSLNEGHLAKSICHQLQQRVRASHDRFVASLMQLEERHLDRLEQKENERKNVRCMYAPQVAKLSLESSSLKDMIQYGMPQLGQELGRGHFGVVYSCKSWAGHHSLAVKTVVLPAEKHWYSLAMEFYYHRSIPEHPRIVQLCGTVVDYKHDKRPTVQLIMERMERDLYSALWNGLAWIPRLQVALDVIQGIRYLHSQGLVHRDIKLHNVLLDKDSRAKISDLGFCKKEVMMSGSVVGTPIHMAPELLTGHYDNSVDIYAFGVLFWYICSGQPRLPYVYEQCSHKEDLFSLIKRGMRPERLPYFDDECWKLMCDCWHANPSRRPLPGEVELRVSSILERYKTTKVVVLSDSDDLSQSHGSDCWSSFDSSCGSKSYLVVTDSVSR